MQDKTEHNETTNESAEGIRELFRKVEDSLTLKLNERIKKEIKRVEVDLFTRYELNQPEQPNNEPKQPETSDIITQYKELI